MAAGRDTLRVCKDALLVTIGSIAFAGLAFGQATAAAVPTDASAKKFAYDVVSIKPSKPTNVMWFKPTINGYSSGNTTVRALLANAYDVSMPQQITGLPEWANSEGFDIQAKMDEETFAAFQKLSQKERFHQKDLMLQALLADRFKLKVHRETRELPLYALVVAKGGFKLKESPQATVYDWTPMLGQMAGHKVTIENLTVELASIVRRFIVDKTGLTGKYDIALKWTQDGQQETADSGPSIFTALQEQLGLKLESTKGPVDVIVVDHVEKPSAN